MAHSYLTLGRRNLLMHDSDLLLTACWLLRHAESYPDRFPESDHPYLSVWRDLGDPYIPGALDLELDAHLADPGAASRFAELAASAREALTNQPEEVSAETLNSIVGAPHAFEYQGRPRQTILDDLDKLVAFVAAGRG